MLVQVLIVLALTAVVDARKTYIVKDQINQGKIQVFSPKVNAYDCEWCFLKDKNNRYCLSGDVDWKLTQLPYTTYNGASTAEGYSLISLSYESQQLLKWQTIFDLKKLYYNEMVYSIDSFKMGFKYEWYYWSYHQAHCLNFATYVEPITVKVTATNKFEECSKVLVKCFDDWSQWTDKTQKVFGDCNQDSASGLDIWTWKTFETVQLPTVETEWEHYWLGRKTYSQNYCFPGPTPLYSTFDKYPSNWLHAFVVMFEELDGAFRAARLALDYQSQMYANPIVRNWDEIKQKSLDRLSDTFMFSQEEAW